MCSVWVWAIEPVEKSTPTTTIYRRCCYCHAAPGTTVELLCCTLRAVLQSCTCHSQHTNEYVLYAQQYKVLRTAMQYLVPLLYYCCPVRACCAPIVYPPLITYVLYCCSTTTTDIEYEYDMTDDTGTALRCTLNATTAVSTSMRWCGCVGVSK